jgi:glycosyltransferase involved in cell wall biosynthesis
MKIIRQGEQADIGLLLEGTFPYVSGGVSSWVNQIIRGFPELRFAICFLGSRAVDYGDMRYELPDNVVHLEAHYLHDGRSMPLAAARHGNKKVFSEIRDLHEQYREPQHASASGQLAGLMQHRSHGRYQDADLLYSREAWSYITEQCRQFCTDPSFIDYFWTVRVMHAPLGYLMDISRRFIPCRAYHSISTGYAGFLGALLKQASGRPLLLSEHGIYTKERKIDLFQAQWIRDSRQTLDRNVTEVAYFRQLWIRFFEALGRECYHNADSIVALYEANRQRQIADGAPAGRTRCIPNGVNLSQLAGLRELRAPGVPPVACLMGRVVPIKDVKTFIRALASASRQLPELQGWIVGPEDEDPTYAQECRHLVNSLGMDDHVSFLGFQKIDRILPKVGVLVLSSISEALPLVILEGFAAGVPSVATDVGSCRQLIEGMDGEDRALGAAGSIVGIADPDALATAIISLLTDGARWQQAQQAGVARVQKYYTQDMMLGSYRRLYEQTLASSPGKASPRSQAGRRWLWRA